MSTWWRRWGSRLGSLATEDPCPEYSSMDARDGLSRRQHQPTTLRRRLVAVPPLEERLDEPARRRLAADPR